MKYLLSLIAALVLDGTAFAQEGVTLHHVADLGKGFKIAMSDERHASGIDHYRYLFFHDRNIGQVSAYSVAPSGKLAVFQRRSDASIFVFRPSWAAPKKIEKSYSDSVREFKWTEHEQTVQVRFHSGSTDEIVLD
jgi:hypothetical protein